MPQVSIKQVWLLVVCHGCQSVRRRKHLAWVVAAALLNISFYWRKSVHLKAEALEVSSRATKQHQHATRHPKQTRGAMKGPASSAPHNVSLSRQDTAGNSFLWLCDLLSWGTCSAATFAIVLDAILLCSFDLQGAEATLHCFGIPMAGAIILAEREVAVLLKLCSFLESWLLKGFYISFVGTLLLAFEHGGAALDLWRRVGGFILIATGVLYVMLGLLCFRQLRSRQLGKIRRKKEMKEELLALSSQKQEIEKLLADTESKLELL